MPKVSAAYLQDRRDGILTSARGLFAERGFARTTMSDVVAATGLSTGALYRYFPSKESLVLAVCEGRDGTVAGAFPAQEPPRRLVERLLGYVRGDGEGRAHARLTTQVWAQAALDPVLAGGVTARHRVLRDALAAALEHPGELGSAPAGGRRLSAPDLAEVALAALVGYAALTAAGAEVDDDGFDRVLAALLG